MANLTEADKKNFSNFILGILDKSADTIAKEGKQDVKFDTDGHKNSLDAKNKILTEEEKKESALQQQVHQQTAIANQALGATYTNASEIADAIVSHMGDGHALSKLIRKERGGMHQAPPKPAI